MFLENNRSRSLRILIAVLKYVSAAANRPSDRLVSPSTPIISARHQTGVAGAAAEAPARELLAAVGLTDSLDLYPSEMSGGMQQRLAIAQALIKRPRILLLDEPFGALDPGIRKDMHALITRLWREHGLTIIMVTHDIKEAFSLGTRVLTLDKRRHDPHAPQRYGAAVIYDLELTRKVQQVHAEAGADEQAEVGGITIDTVGNN